MYACFLHDEAENKVYYEHQETQLVVILLLLLIVLYSAMSNY